MTAPWRVARSLLALRDQLNAAHPGRSTISDGTIGDASHAASVSDHNPDAQGIVRALDVTHDPAHGLDAGALAEQLRRARDPRIKYVISEGRIFSATVVPWTWRTYTGADPHTSHVHVSVVPDSRADTATPWQLGSTVQQEDEMVTQEEIKAIAKATADAVWGEVLPRLDNPVGATAKTQLTAANVYSWRNHRLLSALAADQGNLRATIAEAVAAAAPDVDVDQLAASIVTKLGDLADPTS